MRHRYYSVFLLLLSLGASRMTHAQSWPNWNLPSGMNYSSYGVEVYDDAAPIKNLYINSSTTLRAGGDQLDDIYDDNEVYLTGGTIYASAIDAADFTWNSGTLVLQGGEHTTSYGKLYASQKNLVATSNASLDLAESILLKNGNSLTVENGATVNSSSYFEAGNYSHGTILVQAGGRISTTSVMVLSGGQSRTTELVVDGTGSRVDADRMYVGAGEHSRQNHVRIEDGGTVQCAEMNVYGDSTSGFPNPLLSNYTLVTGEGSSLTVNNRLNLSSPGTPGERDIPSYLDVADGGQVTVGSEVSVANSSWITVGTGGQLRIGSAPESDRALSIGADGMLEFRLGGPDDGTWNDCLTVAGDAELDGTLKLSLIGGYSPVHGASFNIFNWTGEVQGEFASITTPALEAGLEWDTSALYTTGQLHVIPEPGTAALLAVFGSGLCFMRRLKITRNTY